MVFKPLSLYVSFVATRDYLQKGTALGWTRKVLWAVEGGRICFSWKCQLEVVAKELGLGNETELGTWWCVTKRTVSFKSHIFTLDKDDAVSKKHFLKRSGNKGKDIGKETFHTSTDCRMVTLELRRLALSERELISVRDRDRQYLSGGTALCGQVMLALRKGDTVFQRYRFHEHLITATRAKPQKPHLWNSPHSCPRFVTPISEIMSMSLFSRIVSRKLGLTVTCLGRFFKIYLKHYLKIASQLSD